MKFLFIIVFFEFTISQFSVMFCRGVGCIFTEMISGSATFPGMKDAYDQLDKIFRVIFYTDFITFH